MGTGPCPMRSSFVDKQMAREAVSTSGLRGRVLKGRERGREATRKDGKVRNRDGRRGKMEGREGMSRGREWYPNILRVSALHDVRGRNDLGCWCV